MKVKDRHCSPRQGKTGTGEKQGDNLVLRLVLCHLLIGGWGGGGGGASFGL